VPGRRVRYCSTKYGTVTMPEVLIRYIYLIFYLKHPHQQTNSVAGYENSSWINCPEIANKFIDMVIVHLPEIPDI